MRGGFRFRGLLLRHSLIPDPPAMGMMMMSRRRPAPQEAAHSRGARWPNEAKFLSCKGGLAKVPSRGIVKKNTTGLKQPSIDLFPASNHAVLVSESLLQFAKSCANYEASQGDKLCPTPSTTNKLNRLNKMWSPATKTSAPIVTDKSRDATGQGEIRI